jgi:hypothetical protein
MIQTLLAFLLLATQPVELVIISLPVRGAVNLDLAPTGKLELERGSTVSRIRIEIDRPVLPQSVAAGMNTLVVWAASPDGVFENLGALGIVAGKGRLETVTRLDQFALVITAEPHHLVDRPSAAVAYRSLAPRTDSIRRVAMSIPFGYYDYADLQSSTAADSGPAAEAHAAFQIAAAAKAEQWAQAEFRLARVALDTMEELVKRAAPAEAIAPAANEAIGKSVHAWTVARDNAVKSALDSARSDASRLQRDVQQLQDRVQRLTAEQTAAADRIRKLEFDLDRANTEREQLSVSNDAATNRVRRLEGELAQAKRALEELENASTLRLSDDIFDYPNSGLSPGGMTALSKIVAAAGLWKTPIRLMCPEKGVEIAKRYFAQAGVAEDRILIQAER